MTLRAILLLCMCGSCCASEKFSDGIHQIEQLTDQDRARIDKILSHIPVTDKAMNYRNIGERLANIGVTVDSIIIYKIATKREIELPEDRIGDVIYQISTSNPSSVITEHYCDILGSPTYRKRGGKFLPEDKTANWLMTGKCELPQ